MGFIDTASRYYIKSKRLLLKSTRRPSRREIVTTSRIVGLGLLFIGAIGFVVGLLVDFIVDSTKA